MTAQTTSGIRIERQPTLDRLQELSVFTWPIWTKEPSEFSWTYEDAETCYLLEGDVTVTPADGEAVTFGKGNLVTFPAGMSCTWSIRKAVRKHYSFG